ncbi:MAG: MSCRAMM family protein, partial [Nocardioidaceae bacterium]
DHYLVQEFRAPQGYQASAVEFKPFVIDINDVDSDTPTPEVVEFFNQQVPSSLSVVKHDADVAGLIVPGATFELWRESNGTAGLQIDPTTGDTLVHTCTTSADDAGTPADERVCRRSGLPFGTYYWLETAAPTGYELPQLADRLQLADANAVTITRANAGSSFATLVIEDPKKLTDLRVVKLDEDTGLRVGGATFELYLEDNGVAGLQIDDTGLPGPYDQLVGSCSTDPDDSGTPADERVCSLNDLTWGDYYWLETAAPTGYQLPPLGDRLSDAAAGMVTIEAANAGTTLAVTEISDPQVRSVLEVLKRDGDTGAVVGGATFELWRESNGAAGLQVGAGGDSLVD